jgi:hypothetical protein
MVVTRGKRGFSKATLAAALAVQLVVIGALLAAQSGGVAVPAPFLDFDAASIDAISIANEEGAVSLVRAGDEWQLAEGLPADAEKVDKVLDKLADAAGGWPVGSRGATAERFEVTEDSHQRRVTLKAGEEVVADIYLGTSPGYRKTHARHVDGDDDIYAITFANYEAGVQASDWLDRGLLRPEGELAAIGRAGEFSLSRDADGSWVAAGGAALDQAKVETLVGRFTGLSATGVSEAALPDAPAFAFELTDDAGTQTLGLYRLGGEDGDEEYVATSDRVAGQYAVSSYIVEQMDTVLLDLAPDTAEGESEADAEEAEAVAGAAAADAEASADAEPAETAP